MAEHNWALYNAIDGAVTIKSWNAFKDDIDKNNFRWTYEATMKLIPVLIYMMTRGVKIDHERLAATKEAVGLQIAEKEKQLHDITLQKGFELNPRSPKQCVQYFYGILGFPPYVGATGSPTTDDKALARLSRKGCKEAKLVQEIRTLDKLRGTYLDVLTDPDGRLRCSYKPRGTKNGRLSSASTIFGTGMNLQNLHPAFKSFIVADPGMMMFEIDKSQAEWVVTAYACGDVQMIAALESGVDVHAHTAHLITGVPIDLIQKENDFIGHMTDPDEIMRLRGEGCPEIFNQSTFLPRSMTCRQAGKKSNHGLNYYMGYKRFAMENEFPEKESKQIVDGYRQAYSMLPIWWDSLERQLKKDRTLYNCFGRARRFFGNIDHTTLKDGIAYIPQSTVVDLVNDGMIKTYADRDDYMLPIDILMQTHDSVTFQYPMGDYLGCARAILKIKEYLDPPLVYNHKEFHIKSDLKGGLNAGEENKDNRAGMRKIAFPDDVNQLAEIIRAEYGTITSGTTEAGYQPTT